MASATREAGLVSGRKASRIKGASFGLVILLVIQYVLGIACNLYGTRPTANKKIGIFSGPLLALAEIVGTLLVLAAIYLVVAQGWLVVVAGRLVPYLVGHRVGPVAEPVGFQNRGTGS